MEERLRQFQESIIALREALKIQDKLCSHISTRISGCEQAAGLTFSYPVFLAVAAPPTNSLAAPNLQRSTFDSEPKSRTFSSTTLASSTSSSLKRRTSSSSVNALPPSSHAAAAGLTAAEMAGLIDHEDEFSHAHDGSVSGKKRKTTHKPCQFDGCQKLAHGPLYNFCLRHGGGYRCLVPGCTKSAYSTKYCSRHGGGPRCQFPGGCGKGAISNSSFCRRHGGGRRCQFPNCTQGSRAGYDFCLAHGGYTPCSFAQCPCPALHGGEFCRQHNSLRPPATATAGSALPPASAATGGGGGAAVPTNIFAGVFTA